MPGRQTDSQFPLEVGQANCPATRCMQQIKGHRLPSALSPSAIERAIFSLALSPHSIRHAPAQLQLGAATATATRIWICGSALKKRTFH